MTALSAFDLATVGEGASAYDTLRELPRLARVLEDAGYRGLWFGEHHLGAGRVGASPSVLAAVVAATTTGLRVGAAVAVLPHHRPLAVVEAFATIEAVAPGRVDLGLGRGPDYSTIPVPERVLSSKDQLGDPSGTAPELEVGDFHALLGQLLQVAPSDPDGFERGVREVLALLSRPIATIEGAEIVASPGYRSGLQPWLFGFGSLRCAAFAAAHGLPYAINHHVGSGLSAEAVALYRESFVPGRLRTPRVAVSVHAVVARTRADARLAASSYPAWMAHIARRGFSPVVPEPGHPHVLDVPDAARAGFQTGLDLRFIGEPAETADGIRALASSIDADEVLVNTIVHSPGARLRSYELLSDAWQHAADASRREPIPAPV